jgi:hypothetical protein
MAQSPAPRSYFKYLLQILEVQRPEAKIRRRHIVLKDAAASLCFLDMLLRKQSICKVAGIEVAGANASRAREFNL